MSTQTQYTPSTWKLELGLIKDKNDIIYLGQEFIEQAIRFWKNYDSNLLADLKNTAEQKIARGLEPDEELNQERKQAGRCIRLLEELRYKAESKPIPFLCRPDDWFNHETAVILYIDKDDVNFHGSIENHSSLEFILDIGKADPCEIKKITDNFYTLSGFAIHDAQITYTRNSRVLRTSVNHFRIMTTTELEYFRRNQEFAALWATIGGVSLQDAAAFSKSLKKVRKQDI